MKHAKKLILILLLCTGLFFVGCIFLNLFQKASGENVAVSETIPEESSEMTATDVLSNPTLESDAGLNSEQVAEAEQSAGAEQVAETQQVIEPVTESFQEYDITLMAVGDNLIHMGVVYTGQQSDGTYDYSFLFEGISEFLDIADIKIINQETILGGNERGFSGFPYFNSPTEIGDAIANAGFNVVLQASNHSYDQGIDGLLNCVDFWDTHPQVLMTGIQAEAKQANANQTEAEQTGAVQTNGIPLLTIDDVTFAILNYTYSPNMEIIPEELEGHLDLLCGYDESTNRLDFTTLNPQVLADIEKAEELADVTIVCPHWGTEYTTKPSRYQQSFAEQMTAAGADLIIGTHPHVVQPTQWITTENGNQALCYYSLGNYVSTQKNGLSMLEGMAWVTFHVTEEGVSINKESTGVLPMVCHYTSGPVRIESIYFLEDYTAEQAANHGIRSYGGVNLTLEDLTGWSEEILGDWVLPKEKVLAP